VLPLASSLMMALSKSRKYLKPSPREQFPGVSNWVQGVDLNQQPSGYEDQ
jgi:hypothetical protein